MPLISRRGFSGLKIPRVAEAALKKVRNLHERTDHRVRPLRRRTDQSGAKSIAKVHEKMQELHPDIVISIGQAGGRFGVTPERVAINVTDARIPDNEGNQPIDEPIFADGDAAYFSNLPVKAMVQEIRNAGYPSTLSNTAGTYICNHVMYGILYYIQKEFPNVRGGFIHVPYAVSQVVNKPATPSMAIADITAALETAVKAAVEYEQDIKVVGGETH